MGLRQTVATESPQAHPPHPLLLQPSATSGVEEVQDESEANVEKDAEADEGAEVAGHLVRGCSMVRGWGVVRCRGGGRLTSTVSNE